MKLLKSLSVVSLAFGLGGNAVLAAEHIRGTLEKNGADYLIVSDGKTYEVVAKPKIIASLPSLESPSYVNQSNGVKYAFEFKGEVSGNRFHLDEVPVNVAGVNSLTGLLQYDQNSNSYSINGKPVQFGYTKVLNGYEFDEISKNSFIGKEVFAEGYYANGVLVMQALTPTNLFEATEPSPAPEKIQRLVDEQGASKFLFREMIKNENSQSAESFRLKLYENPKSQVVPGDSALIITLGGRQGDSFGSVNGHMVAGLGEVRDDLTIRGEVSNAYVTNDKDILSGNTSLTNYFSHIVQGQNNYRPTYTLIAYGVDKDKLKAFRDGLEESHIKFRSTKLGITPQFNCTTETVKSLKVAGIEGKYRQIDNLLKGIVSAPLALPFLGDTANTIHFSFRNDQSRYQPRAAYESFQRAFLKKKLRDQLGIKRVDFVFYSQFPSHRPVGGMALGKILKVSKFKKLYEKYEVDPKTKLTPEQLRPLLEEILQEVPY